MSRSQPLMPHKSGLQKAEHGSPITYSPPGRIRSTSFKADLRESKQPDFTSVLQTLRTEQESTFSRDVHHWVQISVKAGAPKPSLNNKGTRPGNQIATDKGPNLSQRFAHPTSATKYFSKISVLQDHKVQIQFSSASNTAGTVQV